MKYKIIILLILLIVFPVLGEIQEKQKISILHANKQFQDLTSQYCFESLNLCQNSVKSVILQNNNTQELDYYRLKASYLSKLTILTAKNFPESESLEFAKSLKNEGNNRLTSEITDLLEILKEIKK